jgi:hypothetical protein
MFGARLPGGSDGVTERYVQADPYPWPYNHAIKMVKMQGDVFGAVSDSATFIGAIA